MIKNLIDIFYFCIDVTVDFFTTVFMVMLLGVITIIDLVSLLISETLLRVIGVIIVILIIFIIVH